MRRLFFSLLFGFVCLCLPTDLGAVPKIPATIEVFYSPQGGCTEAIVKALQAAKQTVLVDNLRLTREVLDKFYADTGAYPETLDELVEKNYLKALPFDPVAQGNQKWILVRPKEGVRGRVADLRSSAPGQDRMGRA